MGTFAQIMSTPVQGLALDEGLSDEDRLARLYFSDCAFELGAYHQAITEYESVARRYPKHHSSVYALVQIVNAYTNLESVSEAQAAHRRAMIRLGQIPESAFAEPDALMDRRAWERWIESSPVTTTVQVGTDS
jgi:tetratricopeptide (TPR) repeat protein